jgi:phosphatidylserine decarboxylase
MVRDGYFYAFGFLLAGILVGWFASPPWAVVPLLLALFFLWFFRDPDRKISDAPGAVVSPADGRVTDVSWITVRGEKLARISIFLNVFDVHVNRSPVAGVVRDVQYRRGKFLNAMNEASAEENEQNIVRVEGDGQVVIFKQIAGLLARRIVFTPKPGDHLQRGQRVGLIKFGSRTDLLLPGNVSLKVKVGDRVRGGASVLAYLQPQGESHATVGASVGREAR